jgi:hypothetical protein
MLWIDNRFVGLLSNRLDRFSRKDERTVNCRCPVCGDSQKNKRKARGYIYQKNGKTIYHCHNCNVTLTLASLLKHVDPMLHDEYLKEVILEKNSNSHPLVADPITSPTKPKYADSPLGLLRKVSQLKPTHPAKLYVEARKIPPGCHYRLFYCPKFYLWTNSIVPGKFNDELLAKDHGRLILPFIDGKKDFFGYQGRSLNPADPVRYITIVTDDTKPKIFGLDTVDLSQHVYVVEGPIDSLFLSNAVAMAGSDIGKSKLEEVGITSATFVYDNERRNKQIVARMKKALDNGYKVCLWPESVQEKDINDMILAGKTKSDIQMLISLNTVEGLAGIAELNQWKRC